MSVPFIQQLRVRWLVYGGVILLIAFGVWYFGFGPAPARNKYPQPAWAGTKWPPLVPVRTVEAKLQDLPVRLKAIGTVTALNTVEVHARVGGLLQQVLFEEGQQVEQGQVLAEIDQAPYRNKLAQAQGQLRQSLAQARSARSDLERLKSLAARNLITQQELDVQQALVDQREGAVAAVQAQVDDAQLQLGYTRVEAPLTGRAGFRKVDAGNLVLSSDNNGIVTLTQTRPIAVSFSIAEVDLAKVLGPYRAGEVLEVEAWDRSEKVLLAKGVLRTLDNQIEVATGTLRLKAQFANEDDALFPNQFVNVRIQVRTLEKAVVIPGAAVQFGARGTYVYVIDNDKKARVRDIELGPASGGVQAVTKGLHPGESVVLEGLDRLRDGFGVVISNEVKDAGTP